MDSLHQYFPQLAEHVALDGQWVSFALLLAAGCLTHLVLRFILQRLHRVAVDTAQNWDDVVLAAVEKPLVVGVWIVVAYLALVLSELTSSLKDQLLRAPDTALVLLLAWAGHRLIAAIERELLAARSDSITSTDRATVRATSKLARIALWIVAGLMGLQTVGVSISGLLAFGGIGGIAVGFAAKDLLANFFGGLSIHLDRPFTIGDWVRSPDKEIEGTVESIGWRLTRIRTFDQRPLYVPNAVFSQIALENPSRMFNRRIYETIGLRYQDADHMAEIVRQVRDMLNNHEDIDLTRTLIVNFVSFGPSSLNFFVYAFTKTTVWVDYHNVKEDILLKILHIIHANGADVAFPTQTLQLEQISQEMGA